MGQVLELPLGSEAHLEPGGGWQGLIEGELHALAFAGEPVPAPPRALFPGAFNPLHRGHRAMAASAEHRLGERVGFEISVRNVDKPAIRAEELQRRLGQFAHPDAVWVTTAPTFIEKARLFPGATFVVGADTIVRVGDRAYYAHRAERDRALAILRELECGFLVFGRKLAGDGFSSLSDLELPRALHALCAEVGEEEFRHDISSSELRATD